MNGRPDPPRTRLRISVDGSDDATVELDPRGLEPPAEPHEVRSLPVTTEERLAGRSRHEVTVDGWVFRVSVEDAERAALRERAGQGTRRSVHGGAVRIAAQIPGRVVRVWVAPGDDVEAGQRLLAVEAMKMENEVRAPRAGRVVSVAAAVGAAVELGDELARIE